VAVEDDQRRAVMEERDGGIAAIGVSHFKTAARTAAPLLARVTRRGTLAVSWEARQSPYHLQP
jgi:hypothetical protein